MKINAIFILMLVLLQFSCKEGTEQLESENLKPKSALDSLAESSQLNRNITTQEKIFKNQIDSIIKLPLDSSLNVTGLIDIKEIDPSIKVELKYATVDNFMHKVLYTNLKRALLQKDVAVRLSNVQQKLKTLHPYYSLLVYDAARPVSVQQKMWNALDTIPVKERGKFVSNPANRSLHNFGAALDLTIIDGSGKPLDMGASYDDIRKIAYPSLESKFLASGELTQKQVENRKLLRSVMESQGFKNIPTEWWHFNACSRNEAKKKYKVLMEEPSF